MKMRLLSVHCSIQILAARRFLPGIALVLLACLAVLPWRAAAAVSDDFESHALGSNLHGQGGWAGWKGDANAGALVSSAFSFSPNRSVNIAGTSDLVRTFSGATNGQWVFSVMQYIPSASTGTNYVILLNTYRSPYGNADLNYSVQILNNMATGQIISDVGGSATLPMIKNQWVEFRFEINLAANSVSEFYNGQLLSTHPWQDGTGVNEIRALDLFANNAGPVYYDNVSLAPPALPPPCGLRAVTSTNGATITYYFAGALADPFGSLAAGTPFTGSFSYAYPQTDPTPGNNRGDYLYQSISLTFGNTTVTDSGTGVINVYDSATYPTDLFVLYTFNVSGSLGGLTLAPGNGISLNLQDIAGTAWSSTALPGAGLTMANLTAGNATFIQLQSTPTGSPPNTTIARGPLLPCPCTPPPSNMAAWWPFDEATGTTANDIAGAVNNFGTHNGGATPVTGMVSNALCFDGIDDFVVVTNHPEVNFIGSCTNNAESFTIDAWIRANTNGPSLETLLDKRVNPSSPRGYSVYLFNGRLGLQIADGASQNYNSPSPDLRDGQWHFIAVTVARCGTNGNVVTFYVDATTPSSFVDPRTGDLNNTADLQIGGRDPAFGANYYWGCMDELEIYKRALTANEVAAIYNAGPAGKCKPPCLTAPILICATNKSVACGTAWSFDPPTAAAVCCGTNVTITILSPVTNGVCPKYITQSWLIADACGHTNTCSQTVTVVDTTPPAFTCSTNKTVLPGTPVTFNQPTAQDTCCGTNVTIVVSSTVTNNGPCGPDITRTWRATDCCENASTCSQTITVNSQTAPPQITSVYAPCGGQKITIGFNRPLSPASAQATSNYVINCGGVTVAITQAVLAGPQIVCLFLSQPVGNGCLLIVDHIQDVCGNSMPTSDQPIRCTTEPCARGSTGVEYWLTFPGNYAPDPTNPPQPELFITGQADTVGNVSIPGLAPPFSLNFSIPAAGEVTVPLPKEADLGDANDLIQSKGIHVVASRPVAVYGYNHVRFTTDAYLGLSTRALGESYVVMGYKNVFTDVPELDGSQFAIAAAEDNTTVTIVPSSTVGAHTAGTAFNISMMQGQTYQLRNTNGAPADLTGTIVVADHPIAVFGGHLCANIPTNAVFFCDHLVEQLFPTELWGTSFVTVPLTNRLAADTFRFLAFLTNTTVSISVNGAAVATHVLNQGEFHETQIANRSYVTSDKPILVAQYANSSDYDSVTNSDPFMVLIPPTNLFAASYTVQTPLTDITNNFINVMAPNAATNSQILLDGTPIPPTRFVAIAGSGYVGAQIPVTNGTHTLSSLNGLPFGVVVYGWAKYDSYGYPGGICSSLSPALAEFTCPPTNVLTAIATNCVATVPDLSLQVGNRAAALRITQTPPAGTLVGPGPYSVLLDITDQAGGHHYCTNRLNVFPALICPADIVTNCATPAGRAVFFATNLCGGEFSWVCSQLSGAVFQPGVTTVTCGLNDQSGIGGPGQNIVGYCTFTVTVNCTVIDARISSGTLTLAWAGGGTLQRATNVLGPWVPVPGATSPYPVQTTGARAYFRVLQ